MLALYRARHKERYRVPEIATSERTAGSATWIVAVSLIGVGVPQWPQFTPKSGFAVVHRGQFMLSKSVENCRNAFYRVLDLSSRAISRQ